MIAIPGVWCDLHHPVFATSDPITGRSIQCCLVGEYVEPLQRAPEHRGVKYPPVARKHDMYHNGHRKHRKPHAAKLTRERVQEARELRKDGMTYPELAERYGVCRSTMRAAIEGRTWGMVE